MRRWEAKNGRRRQTINSPHQIHLQRLQIRPLQSPVLLELITQNLPNLSNPRISTHDLHSSKLPIHLLKRLSLIFPTRYIALFETKLAIWKPFLEGREDREGIWG